ncbi:MAG: hypothetical protein ABH826_00360 [Patescibacteria group bacterium]|nr:hypothetical protein [Patescibacteria group bacterium]
MSLENESAWAREKAELQALATNIIREHQNEPQEELFKLMEELKREETTGEVARLMSDWSQKKRMLLQDQIYWSLSKEDQEKYLDFIK